MINLTLPDFKKTIHFRSYLDPAKNKPCNLSEFSCMSFCLIKRSGLSSLRMGLSTSACQNTPTQK